MNLWWKQFIPIDQIIVNNKNNKKILHNNQEVIVFSKILGNINQYKSKIISMIHLNLNLIMIETNHFHIKQVQQKIM